MGRKREDVKLRCIAVGAFAGAIIAFATDSTTIPFIAKYVVWWALISGALYFVISPLLDDD